MKPPWCSGSQYCKTSFNKAWSQGLYRFKSRSRRVEESRWWGRQTMVAAKNKAKRFSSVNNTKKANHHHHHHHHYHHHYLHTWSQRPRICLVAKFGAKIKSSMRHLDIFGREIENIIVIFENSTLELV